MSYRGSFGVVLGFCLFLVSSVWGQVVPYCGCNYTMEMIRADGKLRTHQHQFSSIGIPATARMYATESECYAAVRPPCTLHCQSTAMLDEVTREIEYRNLTTPVVEPLVTCIRPMTRVIPEQKFQQVPVEELLPVGSHDIVFQAFQNTPVCYRAVATAAAGATLVLIIDAILGKFVPQAAFAPAAGALTGPTLGRPRGAVGPQASCTTTSGANGWSVCQTTSQRRYMVNEEESMVCPIPG